MTNFYLVVESLKLKHFVAKSEADWILNLKELGWFITGRPHGKLDKTTANNEALATGDTMDETETEREIKDKQALATVVDHLISVWKKSIHRHLRPKIEHLTPPELRKSGSAGSRLTEHFHILCISWKIQFQIPRVTSWFFFIIGTWYNNSLFKLCYILNGAVTESSEDVPETLFI